MFSRNKKGRKMVMVYLDTKDSILLKSNDRTFHVLYYILRQTNFETNLWYSDKINKTYIMNKLGISTPGLDKHIASLKERNFIKPAEVRGRYRINLELLST
jgi:predicted transcriptional regulator